MGSSETASTAAMDAATSHARGRRGLRHSCRADCMRGAEPLPSPGRLEGRCTRSETGRGGLAHMCNPDYEWSSCAHPFRPRRWAEGRSVSRQQHLSCSGMLHAPSFPLADSGDCLVHDHRDFLGERYRPAGSLTLWPTPFAFRDDALRSGRGAVTGILARHGWPAAVQSSAAAGPPSRLTTKLAICVISCVAFPEVVGATRSGQELLQTIWSPNGPDRREAVRRRRLHQLQPPEPVPGQLYQ